MKHFLKFSYSHKPDERVYPLDNLYFCLSWFKEALVLQEQQVYQDIAPIINLNGMDLICHMTTQVENWCILVFDV